MNVVSKAELTAEQEQAFIGIFGQAAFNQADKFGVPETKPAKPFPKVGDTIHIRHQVNRNKQGEVFGINRNDRPYADKITAVYMDGTVRTGISDVWSVRPATNNSWETINPDREEK